MENSPLLNKKNDRLLKVIRYGFISVMFIQFAVFAVLFILDPNGEQRSVFFRGTDDFFADLFNVAKYTCTKDPYCYSRKPSGDYDMSFYLPLANMVFYFLSQFSNYIELSALNAANNSFCLTVSFLSVTFMILIFFAVIYGWLQKKLPQNRAQSFLIAAALFCSGVFMYSFERGNIIFLAVALSGFFLIGYKSENKIIRELSYLSLALAAALKIYPAVFGILLLCEKRWKDAIRLIIYGAVAVFLPFLFFEGGFKAIPLFIENYSIYNKLYNDSIFDRLNYRYFTSYGGFISNNLAVFLYSLMPIVDTLFSIVCIASVPLQKEEWKKYAALIMPIVIFPSNSGLYNCLYVFLIIVCFMSKKEYEKKDIIYCILFLLMLTPLQKQIQFSQSFVDIPFRLNTIILNITTWLIFCFIAVSGIILISKFLREKIQLRIDNKNCE